MGTCVLFVSAFGRESFVTFKEREKASSSNGHTRRKTHHDHAGRVDGHANTCGDGHALGVALRGEGEKEERRDKKTRRCPPEKTPRAEPPAGQRVQYGGSQRQRHVGVDEAQRGAAYRLRRSSRRQVSLDATGLELAQLRLVRRGVGFTQQIRKWVETRVGVGTTSGASGTPPSSLRGIGQRTRPHSYYGTCRRSANQKAQEVWLLVWDELRRFCWVSHALRPHHFSASSFLTQRVDVGYFERCGALVVV